jgi:hypothetical protein
VHGVNGPSNLRGSAAGAKTAVRALLFDVGDSGATVAVAYVARASADAPGNTVRLLAVRRSSACAGALMTDTVVALVRKQFGGAQALTPKALVRLHAEAVKQRAVLSNVECTDLRLESSLEDRDLARRVTRAELLAESERSLAQLDALVANALAAVPETSARHWTPSSWLAACRACRSVGGAVSAKLGLVFVLNYVRRRV